MDEPAWREIEHTADWALEIRGKDHAQLFENAARGMASLLGGRSVGRRTSRKRLRLIAPDWETLLVDWLSELLFWLEEEGLILHDVRIERIKETEVRAEATGTKGTDLGRHIKAVTYNDLAIRAFEGGLETTIVFDV
jgi:SHS2 domain-containing protein